MTTEYISRLLQNLPNDLKRADRPTRIDLVLDGGAFNGSYLIGALQFLREMEQRGWVRVGRISGTSIGAICAILYQINALDSFEGFYTELADHFRQHHNLDKMGAFSVRLRALWGDHAVPHRRLYLSYWDIRRRRKIVRSTYKDADDLIRAAMRSCFIPFAVNGDMLYEGRYMDGARPYVFKRRPHGHTLHLNLWGADKLNQIWNIRNETTNLQRVLAGMLDIHAFFIKGGPTAMCSYVEDWWYYDGIHAAMEWVAVQVICWLYFLSQWRGSFGGALQEYSKSRVVNILARFGKVVSAELIKLLVELCCF